MGFIFILTLACLFNFHPTIADEGVLEVSSRRGTRDADESSSLEIYIVHVTRPELEALAESHDDLERWYRSFLPVITEGSKEPSSRMVYAYRHVISGFAARLTKDEVKAMEEKEGFVMAWPQKVFPLHTTHSPSFMGLHQNFGLWKGSNFGKGVIIGLLDSGVTPTHPSFSDKGVPPPPARWKGKCEFNRPSCNNKLIGARNFQLGANKAPFDKDGHGTHTASTAAGNYVNGANVYGNDNGTAVGMAPLAHLAIYRVCHHDGCPEADLLAGIDAAVEDEVDVLSLSLGADASPFHKDTIAIGTFRAMEKGIFVSCSAGNSGPYSASVSNGAPWILTVGASTLDRSVRATALLGNKDQLDGESLFQPRDFPATLLHLVYFGDDKNASWCIPGSLNHKDVKGKVVLCERGGDTPRVDRGQEVKDAGGAAMILMNLKDNGCSIVADDHVLPATHVSYAAGQKIKAYIKSNSNPTATILFKGTVIGGQNAPIVSSFSSRGPNQVSPGILKPDIIGPGVSILAAWPFSVENNTNTLSTFNVISGTSMSCPHLSGIAALLKSSHPDWSPAAIKSAIMTTADILNLGHKPILDERLLPADMFAIGAGHVNPSRANHPGLVYDIQTHDYIRYLCGLGYTDTEVGSIARRKIKCAKESPIPEAKLNYPSFSIALIGPRPSDQTYFRKLTNVGKVNSSYRVHIIPPPGVNVTVKPQRLHFSKAKKKRSYRVTFSRLATGVKSQFAQGYLQWVSDKHLVRSPISVMLAEEE